MGPPQNTLGTTTKHASGLMEGVSGGDQVQVSLPPPTCHLPPSTTTTTATTSTRSETWGRGFAGRRAPRAACLRSLLCPRYHRHLHHHLHLHLHLHLHHHHHHHSTTTTTTSTRAGCVALGRRGVRGAPRRNCCKCSRYSTTPTSSFITTTTTTTRITAEGVARSGVGRGRGAPRERARRPRLRPRLQCRRWRR